jgi:hypothetical protein
VEISNKSFWINSFEPLTHFASNVVTHPQTGLQTRRTPVNLAPIGSGNWVDATVSQLGARLAAI